MRLERIRQCDFAAPLMLVQYDDDDAADSDQGDAGARQRTPDN